MKKTVIYARYSSDSQTEQSIDWQLRVAKNLLKRMAMKLSLNISTGLWLEQTIIAQTSNEWLKTALTKSGSMFLYRNLTNFQEININQHCTNTH